jgi:hypothetical protein
MGDKMPKYLVCNFYILQDIVTESDQFRFTSTSQTACSKSFSTCQSMLLLGHWFISVVVLNPVYSFLVIRLLK